MIKKVINKWREEYDRHQIKSFPLRFRDPEIERSFREDILENDLDQLRFSSIMAIFAYGVFIIIDVLCFSPEETVRLLILRGIGLLCLGGLIWFTYSDVVKKHYSWFTAIMVALVGITVLLMILVTDSLVRRHYYVGVIFTLIYGYGLMPSRFVPIYITGFVLMFGYLGLSIFFYDFPPDLIMVSNMLLIAMNFVGVMIVYNLEFQRRADFYTRVGLKHSQGELSALNDELEQRISDRTRKLESSNRDLQDFVYVISHDLKEPLRQVSGYVSLIERRYKGQLDDKADEFIDFAVDGANRMAMMIDSLLEFSRLETRGKTLRPVDCDLVMEKTLQMLRRLLEESQANLHVEALPVVLGDASQLLQLFQNLISNSIKYAGDAPPEIFVSASYDPEMLNWRFVVRDHGIGIAQEDLENIFVLFKRGENVPENVPGTGVGLSICKRIIERHNGQLWVESEIGKGASFYFTLLDKKSALDPFSDHY